MSPPTKQMKPTKRVTCIEDLPPEMICELFEYLPPKDLAACSMVNKRWHSIYAAFKLHRLAAIDRDRERIRWYGSNRPIQEAERCGPAMFLRLAEKPLLSNLKHLALFGSFKFDLNKLNRFQQLVHLEINIDLDEELQLNLPRLRVLAFLTDNFGCALSINCPELSTLAYYEHGQANLLDVKHPETIRVLETNLVGQQLAPFKSVESLEAWEFKAISMATLLSLPRLRELHYNDDIVEFTIHELNSTVGTIDLVKRTVSEFMYEAKKLRGRDFRFSFAGFQLANVNVDQIDFGVEVDEEDEYESVHNEYIYLKNYHLIEPGALHFLHRVDYTRLMSNVTGEFPRCFFQKFTGINVVEVDGVVKDPDHFLWFLKSLRSLRTLILYRSELSQEFYDQLPASARSLVSLELHGYWKGELQLNFDFIDEFSLSKLKITRPLSLSSATSLARWLSPLKEASIHIRPGRDLWIKKARDSALWKIQPSKDARDSLFETENPGELVSFFAGFRAALLEQASD